MVKPSISIDLPGWCTLRRTPECVDGLEESRPGEPKDVDSDGELQGSSIGDERTSTGGGDSDDEDDGNAAIARLFSIGVKRKRRASYSGDASSRASSADVAEKSHGRQSIGSSRELDRHAEAYSDWGCVRCTFINVHNQEICQACGSANLRRVRLHREHKERRKQLERLRSARELQDRSQREEALKDVLEDSSDSEQGSALSGPSRPGSEHVELAALAPPDEHSEVDNPPGGADVSANPAPKAEIDGVRELASGGKTEPTNDPNRNRCFINVLPGDLLLQCTEFLGEIRTLCYVREVCRGWLVSLDGLEAGYRSWRAVFYRLRASGTIHAATDTRGQRRCQPKIYDLSSSVSVESGTPVSSAGTAAKFGLEDEIADAVPGSAPGAEIGTTGGTPRRSSACLVCGLIQRNGYTGRDCEMCASSLVMVSDGASPSTPRVPYKRVNVSGDAMGDMVKTRPSPMNNSSPTISKFIRNSSRSTSLSSVAGSTGVGVLNCTGGSRGEAEAEDEGSVDWHFLVKKLAVEKRIAAGWGTLHHGWVWLQGVLQAMLRRRRGDERMAPSTSRSKQPGHDPGMSSSCDGANAQGMMMMGGGEDGMGELDPTIARVVRKLASKNWVLLYDSLKTTFTLQANGLARAVVSNVETALAATAAEATAAMPSTAAAGKQHRVAKDKLVGALHATVDEFEGVRACASAWEAFKDWCEEVDMYCELLNEQISAERYRTAGAGCGRGDHTPFIRDTAFLSFRNSFALNVQICSILRTAIAKGASALRPAAPTSQGREEDRGTTVREVSVAPSSPWKDTVVHPVDDTVLAATEADELFTDVELVDDSRAVDFSVRSYTRHCSEAMNGYCARGAAGAAQGDARQTSMSWSGVGRRGMSCAVMPTPTSYRDGSKQKNYYDWFLRKLEGQEMGIIRGDVDARGKKMPRTPSQAGRPSGCPDGGAYDVGTGAVDSLQGASLEELLDVVRDMVEELDVPDDSLSKDRRTQGAMRRLLLLPIKRWQAEMLEGYSEDPHNLLMAGLSPAPGKEGLHRLRGGAAVRRKGTPPLSALAKDGDKSWKKLSSFFG